MQRLLKMMMLIGISIFLTTLAFAKEDGWRYTRKNVAGTGYYPNTSKVLTDNKLTEQFSLPVSGGSVLTGDVTGDGFIEVVHVNGSQLRIYDHQGNQLQNFSLGSSNCIVTMIEDVNGDGIDDIGIGTFKTSSLKTYFYDGNGNLLQVLSKTAGRDSSMTPVGLTGSGDYIISLTAGYSHANKHRGIALYDKVSGAEKWQYKVGPSHRVTSVADFDNDGLLEITGRANTVHNGCVGSGVNGNGTKTSDGDMWLIVVDETGKEVFSEKYPSPSDGSSQHYFVDLNKDGQMEILGFESHDPRYYKGVSQVHLFDQAGTATKTFNGNDNQGWSFAVADMTGDGKDEVVTVNGRSSSFTLHILDAQLNQLKSKSVEGHVQLVADINGDGKNEIAILSSSGDLSVYDANLNKLDAYSVNTNGNVIASDLDKDGIVELICLTDSIHVIKNTALNSSVVPPDDKNCKPLPLGEEIVISDGTLGSPAYFSANDQKVYVNFDKFCDPVDIFLAVQKQSGNLFFIDSEGSPTYNFNPYRINQTGSLKSSISINHSDFFGNCVFYWLIGDSYYNDIYGLISSGRYELGVYSFSNYDRDWLTAPDMQTLVNAAHSNPNVTIDDILYFLDKIVEGLRILPELPDDPIFSDAVGLAVELENIPYLGAVLKTINLSPEVIDIVRDMNANDKEKLVYDCLDLIDAAIYTAAPPGTETFLQIIWPMDETKNPVIILNKGTIYEQSIDTSEHGASANMLKLMMAGFQDFVIKTWGRFSIENLKAYIESLFSRIPV